MNEEDERGQTLEHATSVNIAVATRVRQNHTLPRLTTF